MADRNVNAVSFQPEEKVKIEKHQDFTDHENIYKNIIFEDIKSGGGIPITKTGYEKKSKYLKYPSAVVKTMVTIGVIVMLVVITLNLKGNRDVLVDEMGMLDMRGVLNATKDEMLERLEKTEGDIARLMDSYFGNVSEQIKGLTCRYPYTLSGAYCYHVKIDKGYSYDAAVSYCSSQHGHLANVASPQKQAAVVNYLGQGEFYVWIGLKYNANKLEWSDTREEVTWANWAPGNPTATERCVRLGELQFVWRNDIPCSYGYWPLCEISPYKN